METPAPQAPPKNTETFFSHAFHGLAWTGLVLAALLSIPCLCLYLSSSDRDSHRADPYAVLGLGFVFLILGAAILFFSLIPAGVRCAVPSIRRGKDWKALRISAMAMGLVAVDIALLCGTPTHGSC